MTRLKGTLPPWLELVRDWGRSLIPLATLLALATGYFLLKTIIDSGGQIDVAKDAGVEVAKVAWAACQLVVFSALGWHIVIHAWLFHEESGGLPRALTPLIWLAVPLASAIAAWHFFRSEGAVPLVAAVTKEIGSHISSVNDALDAANTLAVAAVGFLAAWCFALLRPEREAADRAALAGRLVVSLNSSAALLVVALVNMWVLYQVPAAIAEAAGAADRAGAYRLAANGIVLAAGICFSAILVLLYLPLLAMLRRRGMLDEAAISGSLAATAKTFAPILAPAISGLIGALPLLLKSG
jgi:hypothetical protein